VFLRRDLRQPADYFANPNLTVLVEAVVAADLATTLTGPGPFTVFAPTDAAFSALLSELGMTKAQLLAVVAGLNLSSFSRSERACSS
jgi:uncharacterized surface protein with fasciclin (FAS1) repeats